MLPAALRFLQHPLRHFEEWLEEAVEAVVGVLEEGVQLPGEPLGAWGEADTLDRGVERQLEEGMHAAVGSGAVLEDVIHLVLQQGETFFQVLEALILPPLLLQQ